MESFDIIYPSPVLAPYVSHYWTLRAGGAVPAGERIIPTGSVSLVFHRADLMMSRTGNRLQPRAFLSGISTGFTDLQATGMLDMLVVVFRPSGCGAFLSVPLDEFRNMDVAVGDTGDAGLVELAERVFEQSCDTAAVAFVERFLVSRLCRGECYSRVRVEAAMRAISADPSVNVVTAAGIACLSERQFNRVFSATAGTRPKDFIRIVRFQRALYTLQSDTTVNFAQLAAASGYYDQAHMIREFRRLSGYTPAEYIAVCAPYSDYFTEL